MVSFINISKEATSLLIEILEHEKNLYTENERYTREELEKIFAETKTKK